MFTHTNFFKSLLFFFFLNFFLIFNLHAYSNEDIRGAESIVNNPSQIKNETIGSWWMWATGSGLIVLLIFAFRKEEESMSFKK